MDYMDDNLSEKELAENPGAKLMVQYLLDISGSMIGDPIKELNAGIMEFVNETRSAIEGGDIDTSFITFGGKVTLLHDFRLIGYYEDLKPLKADGNTPMGEAVNLALTKMKGRLDEYKKLGCSSKIPWLIIISDGCPTDRIAEMQDRVRELEAQKRIIPFLVCIGNNSSKEEMLKFTNDPKRVFKMDPTKFKQLFKVLSMSARDGSKRDPIADSNPVDLLDYDEWEIFE